ncbi:Hypothetical predicted protein [Lynx pardinus]|uniref:Uncharacterized protein n=1 Tax=Lynx pardinus TaxID=191816 RepID=A0A485P1Z4_LYNPA|nr:Hypothetical predicted protein [Lynx pardinus]
MREAPFGAQGERGQWAEERTVLGSHQELRWRWDARALVWLMVLEAPSPGGGAPGPGSWGRALAGGPAQRGMARSPGAPGWRSRLSVRLQPGHDLAVREFEPRVGLWADGSEPGACFRFCVSFSLCPSPVHALSLSVPKINKR